MIPAGDFGVRTRGCIRIPPELRPVILFRLFVQQRGRCAYCLKPLIWLLPEESPSYSRWASWRLSVDHVIPLADGGPTIMANLVAAHLRCNTSKGRRRIKPRLPVRQVAA